METSTGISLSHFKFNAGEESLERRSHINSMWHTNRLTNSMYLILLDKMASTATRKNAQRTWMKKQEQKL